MQKLIFFIPFLFASAAQAVGTVDFLKIDKDMVLFSTTVAKTNASPTCVTTDNADIWAVSLKSESGRAMYSLIVTAMAKDLGLDVESANDCADAEGVERAGGVNMTPVVSEHNTGKVKWAGYTAPIQGNFAALANKSGLLAGSEMCSALYPNSRMMLWEDYTNIITTYPHTYQVWFADSVEALGINGQNGRVILKSGESLIYKDYSRDYNAVFVTSCVNWMSNSSNSQYRGIVLNKNGRLSQQYCSNSMRIACVK
jgi:hypothetical protein